MLAVKDLESVSFWIILSISRVSNDPIAHMMAFLMDVTELPRPKVLHLLSFKLDEIAREFTELIRDSSRTQHCYIKV